MRALLSLFIVCLSITIPIQFYGSVLIVKQDGSGDFSVIQHAINAAQEGDTILVWPGTYYENIDFTGKNITVASLMLTTGDENYKYSTVIDGNHNGSCVKVMSGETNAILFGLSLKNGSGTVYGQAAINYGGGIYVIYSSCTVHNCIISNNNINGPGGGIYCFFESHLVLSGTSIFNNHAHDSGGGIFIGSDCTIVFDSTNLCNLYLNFASRGCDFHKTLSDPVNIYLDTCSVLYPDSYYISSVDLYGYQVDDITLYANNYAISLKNADLYVNPVTGNNNNSGLSPSEPLQSIAYAYSSIDVDSIDKNTINLANGIYSDSSNNEKFPLNIKPYINVEGQSTNNTILDGKYKSRIIKGNNEVSNYTFSNMTMYRGGSVDYTQTYGSGGFAYLYAKNDNLVFDSIIFKNGLGYTGYGQVHIESSNNVLITNCKFNDNVGAYALRFGSDSGDTVTVTNCIFDNNMPDYQQQYVWGGSLALYGYNTTSIVQGCLFSGNNYYNIGVSDSYSVYDTYFVNCTFTSNTLNGNNGASIGINDANCYMYNCISYDEGVTPFSLYWNETIDTISLEIYNSLIEGAEESITIKPGLSKLVYDPSNIDTVPVFYEGAEFPFNLADNSPCIDVGTLELPNFIDLPDVDLAGNPRVWNGAIDMGAYEWNPTVGYEEFQANQKEKRKLLQIAPNPFRQETTITAYPPLSGHIVIEVYNNVGRRVKLLMDKKSVSGTSNLNWQGDDDHNNLLPGGIYYIVLSVNGKVLESLKVAKL